MLFMFALLLDMTWPIDAWSIMVVYVLMIFFMYLLRLIHFFEETVLDPLRICQVSGCHFPRARKITKNLHSRQRGFQELVCRTSTREAAVSS